jgi:hypothetical protein
MTKPIAIDLFCGKGGWTNALLEEGFEVYGFDIEPQPDYKGIFIQRDILTLPASELRYLRPSFATCSSPCEQFSVHGMKHFHPNPKYPEMGIKLFNHARSLLEELDIPYVMENVRPTEKFVGKAVNHCGPFYLWGTGVPAMFHPDAYKVTKGIDWGSSKDVNAMKTQEEKRQYRDQPHFYNRAFSTSPKRKADIAQAAMIPLPIARAVAEVAIRLTQTLEVA